MSVLLVKSRCGETKVRKCHLLLTVLFRKQSPRFTRKFQNAQSFCEHIISNIYPLPRIREPLSPGACDLSQKKFGKVLIHALDLSEQFRIHHNPSRRSRGCSPETLLFSVLNDGISSRSSARNLINAGVKFVIASSSRRYESFLTFFIAAAA